MDTNSIASVFKTVSDNALSFFTNPWIGILSFAMGLIGFYLRIKSAISSAKRRKIPSYKKRSINVISENTIIPNLTVSYRDSPVRNLTVTKVAIWNSGKETINAGDVPEGDPIRIPLTGEGMEVYSIDILHVTERSNKFELETVTEFYASVVKFDYIDYNQGILLRVIHSGKSSDDIKVLGTVKGFGKITDSRRFFWDNLSVIFLKGVQV